MMDTKAIDEISAAVEKLAIKYPHIKLCVVMAQPCAKHNGMHIDLAYCGESGLTALVDQALLTFNPGGEVRPANASVQ